MATQSVSVTLGTSFPNNEWGTTGGNVADVAANFAAYDTAATTFAAALATLVADGASPTQAHVTAANNAYTTLAGKYTTLKAQTNGADFLVVINLAVITSRNALLAAWKQALQIFAGSGTAAAS